MLAVYFLALIFPMKLRSRWGAIGVNSEDSVTANDESSITMGAEISGLPVYCKGRGVKGVEISA